MLDDDQLAVADQAIAAVDDAPSRRPHAPDRRTCRRYRCPGGSGRRRRKRADHVVRRLASARRCRAGVGDRRRIGGGADGLRRRRLRALTQRRRVAIRSRPPRWRCGRTSLRATPTCACSDTRTGSADRDGLLRRTRRTRSAPVAGLALAAIEADAPARRRSCTADRCRSTAPDRDSRVHCGRRCCKACRHVSPGNCLNRHAATRPGVGDRP